MEPLPSGLRVPASGCFLSGSGLSQAQGTAAQGCLSHPQSCSHTPAFVVGQEPPSSG